MFCHLLCDDGSIYWALAKVKVLIPHVDFDSWSRIFVKGVLGGLMWKLLEEGHHVLMLQPFRRFSFGAIIDRTAEAAP